MKRCFKCGALKERNEFYGHPQMADGLLGKCKDCTKRDVKARIAIKKTQLEWVLAERARCRVKQATYFANGKATPHPEAGKRWALRNPSKRKAHFQAAQAVRCGALIKPDICQSCGLKHDRLHKHHHDYARPIDVQWLCSSCHGLKHRKLTL